MRFRLGAPIATGTPPAEIDGWTLVKEPRPWITYWVLGLPVGLALLIGTAGIMARYTSIELEALDPRAFLVLVVALIPAHECVHMLFLPDRGRSRATIVGVWPAHLIAYVQFCNPWTRREALRCLGAPFVVLSVVPLACGIVCHIESPALGAIILSNAVGSSIDVLSLFLIAIRVPAGALLWDHGPKTYWRRSVESSPIPTA